MGRLRITCTLLLLLAGCGGPQGAKVKVKFDIYGGDNSFAATIYAQEIRTGQTTLFPYGPHTPYIMVELKTPGTYVFYARLVEAPEDYHYGYTGNAPVAYGHGARGGTQNPSKAGLIPVVVAPQGQYQVYINDHRAILPVPGKPVSVPLQVE